MGISIVEVNGVQRVFDREVRFDERSRDFRAAADVEDRPLRSRTYRCKKRLDQGTEGSCTGHMAAHNLISYPQELLHVGSAEAVALYKLAQKRDQWAGEAYEGSSNLGVAKAVCELYPDEIVGFDWCFGVRHLLSTVAWKDPVGIGVNWYEGMCYPDEQGRIFKSGAVVGGHSLEVRGQDLVWMPRKVARRWEYLNTDDSVFKLQQSWGLDHGGGREPDDEGVVYLSVGEMDALLQENGDAVRFKRAGSIFA